MCQAVTEAGTRLDHKLIPKLYGDMEELQVHSTNYQFSDPEKDYCRGCGLVWGMWGKQIRMFMF